MTARCASEAVVTPDAAAPDQLWPELQGESPRNHVMDVMTSSKDMTWGTPQQWFDYLDLEFDFTLDPCCVEATAKCALFYTPETDGLAQSWANHRVFMNPPYGPDIYVWMEKAYNECRNNGALVVCFVPARVDTNWWHNFAAKATDIRFPKGRVKFAGADANAPFPVAVVIFRPRVDGQIARPSRELVNASR
jgi:phage N-6-adenine-methyltransferase